MFKGRMKTAATPERVYALCKIVEAEGIITSSKLKEKMEPSFLSQATVYYGDYRTAAEELGLIKNEDNMISLAVDPAVIATLASMRGYINGRLEQMQDGPFYKVTKSYFEIGKDIFHKENSVSSLVSEMKNMTGESTLDADGMRAWRFWASFLGFGYLHDMFVIPNAKVFLEDLIISSELELEHLYSFGEFIDILRPRCNILFPTDVTEKSLNFGVSAGLRALHDCKEIELQHILDQQDIWNLCNMPAHAIKGTVTNITILGRDT